MRPRRQRARQGGLCRDGVRCARTGRSRDRAAASPARDPGAGGARSAGGTRTPRWCCRAPRRTVTIFVAGVFAPCVADRFVLIAPGGQAGVDAILVGMDEGALSNGARDDRLDRPLLHVGQHVQDHRTSALDQAEDRGLVLFQRAPAPGAGQPPTAPEPPLLATAAGWPLWPATT